MILSVFPGKNSKTQSSLNYLQSGPRKFTKPDFSGLAPIRRVLSSENIESLGSRLSSRGGTRHEQNHHNWQDFHNLLSAPKNFADPGNCFQELASEKLLNLLRDRPCLELIIVSSKFQALLFVQDKLLESVRKLSIPVKFS